MIHHSRRYLSSPASQQFLTKHLFSISIRKYRFHFAKCKNKTSLGPFKGQSQSHHWGPFIPAATPSSNNRRLPSEGMLHNAAWQFVSDVPGGKTQKNKP